MKKCLFIDGGGMKGMIPCGALERIEVIAGRPIWQCFDLIGGTSIGAILAALLAIGIPADQLRSLFLQNGSKIFTPAGFTLGGLAGPRYTAAGIEGVLQSYFGTLTMSAAKTRLLITAYNVLTGKPAMFTSYHPLDLGIPIWKSCRASSAAQTFLPGFDWDGVGVFWDGGNVANSPGCLGLAEAVNLWGWDDQIKVLSLGCGSNTWPFDGTKLIGPGLMTVAKVMCESLIGAEQEEVDFQLQAFLGKDYTRINPDVNQEIPIDGVSPAQLEVLEKWADLNAVASNGAIKQFFGIQ